MVLGEICIFACRCGKWKFLGTRRGESRQPMTRGEHDVSRICLSGRVSRLSVIAAIGLNTATVGIDRVDFRACI